MIKQSFLSLLLAAAGVGGAAIFTQTFGGTYYFPEGIAISLILMGLVMGLYFGVEAPTEEGDLPEVENEQKLALVGTLAIAGLGIFAVLGFIIPQIKFATGSINIVSFAVQTTLPTLTSSQQIGSFVFSCITIPNAEEQFFRGFWGNLMLRVFPPGIAEVMSGVIFMIFHTAVYSLLFPGLNFNLIFILIGAGATFVAIDAYSQDITTSVLAHMGNNALSFLVGGSIIAKVFPSAHLPWAPGLIIIAFPMSILAYKAAKYGRLPNLAKLIGGLRA